MSTLTDRYVWGVLRAVPTTQRADLEPEIRAMVADAVEARVTAGTIPAEAERAAITELGDPDLLAARFADRTLALIGPGYYPDWKRLLTLLLPIVVPIAAFAVVGAGLLGGRPVGQLILDGAGAALMIGVQLTFWVTLVFALLERSGQPTLGEAWTPDRLPELPAGRKGLHPAEVAVSIVAMVVGAGLLVWQQSARPLVIDGVGYPVLDPALWSFWMPYLLALLAVELVALLWRWRTGGWTWAQATLNLVTNVAFIVPGIYLLQNGLLLDPGLLAAIDRLAGTGWLAPAVAVITVIVIAASAWDTVDGFRQAVQNRQTRSR